MSTSSSASSQQPAPGRQPAPNRQPAPSQPAAAPQLPRLFDVHQHILPPVYLDALAAAGIDPAREDGFPTPQWGEKDARTFADGMNIGFSLLSISSPHVNWGDDAASARLCRRLNDYASRLCAADPAHYGFVATLPVPDVTASVAEARRALALPGALAVKLPTNACGVYLGNQRLDPLMAELDARSAVVVVHPTKPSAVPQGQFAADHAPVFEFLADTTRAVLNLITSGTLDRYPRVRWIVPHCGAFVPEVAHRMQGISRVLVPAGMMASADVLSAVRALYFDLASDAEPVMLDALLKVADPSHLLYGSDWPYTPAPLARQKALALFAGPHAAALEPARWRNAAALLGIN